MVDCEVRGSLWGIGPRMSRVKGVQRVAFERAIRLRKLRSMAGLSRRVFAERYGVAQGTLQNWESPRNGGLTEPGAHTVIRCFSSEGVNVSYQWLMMGLGKGPLPSISVGVRKKRGDVDRVLFDEREAECFKKANKNSIVYTLSDNCMRPKYAPGDLFMGVPRRTLGGSSGLIDRLCIIQGADGRQLLRYVKGFFLAEKKVNTLSTSRAKGDFTPVFEEIIYQKIWLVVYIRLTGL